MNTFEVKINIEGTLYVGSAKVDKGSLTVSSVLIGRKSASVSSNNQVLAELLLRELVTDAKRKNLVK